MKRIYGTIIYLIIFMDSAGKLSGKWNLVKLGTVFPPQISCMGRIVPCRLVMKVTVMLLLSSVSMFPLLLQEFHCLTSLFKNKLISTIFVHSIQRNSLETQKQDSLLLICTFKKVILGFPLSLNLLHNHPTYGKNLKRIQILKENQNVTWRYSFCFGCNKY